MTFWLIGCLSCFAKSYETHGIDYGMIALTATTCIYLLKFFAWETPGYMRTLDISLDNVGWYEQWGCLVWVPSVYLHHNRVLVMQKSNLSKNGALFWFSFFCVGFIINYVSDLQKMYFREQKYKGKYVICTTKDSLISNQFLVSGLWGIVRHPNYIGELMMAYSWGCFTNTYAGFVYPIYLTILLCHRCKRDEDKCYKKYGNSYNNYVDKVPFYILPRIF